MGILSQTRIRSNANFHGRLIENLAAARFQQVLVEIRAPSPPKNTHLNASNWGLKGKRDSQRDIRELSLKTGRFARV